VIRISTRGRYALRAMVDVARHGDETPVPRQGIAERQNISSDYVAQLFRELAEAGLVEGVKGPGGGYRLALPAAAITAQDVVEAVEGPIALVHCVVSEEDPTCNRVDRCVTHLLWKELSEAMTAILSSVTLEDLSQEADQFDVEEAVKRGERSV
jgi:Rrf2 family protein